MTLKKFFTTRTVILLALAAMVVLAFLSYNSILKLNSLASSVDHTHVTQLNLQKTYSALSDADNELKSFLITKDSFYYFAWTKKKAMVDHSMALLDKLTADNPIQAKRITSLDSLIQVRRQYMVTSLKADESQYEDLSAKIEECNTRLENAIEVLDVEEERLLQQRLDRSSQFQFRAPFSLLSLQVAVVICLLIGFILVTSDLRAKAKLQRALLLNNKELKDQRDFIQGIFDNTVDVIMVLDTKLNIVALNKRARQLYDPNNDAIGKNLVDQFPQASESQALKGIHSALEGKHSHLQVVQSIIHPEVFFESFFVPLYSGDKVSGVVAIHHDISELVKMSADIRGINQQLQKSNLELEQFAYVTSHDLQEPLRKIQTFSDLAYRSIGNNEAVTRNLNKIFKSAERMSVLIRDILNYSRLATPEVQPNVVNLNEVVDQVIQDFELLIQEKNVMILFEKLPNVLGSKQQLTQVLSNIISNSIKFAKENPVIKITCTSDHDHITLSIADNGIGFEQIYADQIFRVFQRLHSQSEFSGTGIGLALCKKIIENHQGTISATSTPNQGTKITITLPALKDEMNTVLSDIDSLTG